MADPNPVESFEIADGVGPRVLELSARAATALNAHSRTSGLVASLPDADAEPLRIAVWGPYSAGKSTLIAALLQLAPDAVEELVSAEPKTLKPTPYYWNGAVLLDLPGTFAGIDQHSDAARAGLRSADVLMIVTTVELAGEAETRAILQALDKDGFADRSVVVINKMNAENSDPDIILEETRTRLGPFADRVPILPTDARDYVDAINDPGLTEDERESLVLESGVPGLAEELHRIIELGVDRVRPQAQAFELVRVLSDAEELWHLEGEALSAAETASQVAQAIADAKGKVLATADTQSDAVASVIRAAGSRAASSVVEKDPNVSEGVLREVDEKRSEAIDKLERRVFESARVAFDALFADYGSQVPEPTRWTFDVDSLVTEVDGSPGEESPLKRNTVGAGKEVLKAGARKVGEFVQKVADSTNEKGSMASDIATRINESRFGHKLLGGEKVAADVGKWKPHGRGKAANKVAGAAGKLQWAALVIGPALDLSGVADDQLKRMKLDKHRKKIKSRFDGEAVRTQTDLSESVRQWLSEWTHDIEQSLRDLTNPGTAIIAEREEALGEIHTLRLEAEDLVQKFPQLPSVFT